MPLKSNKVDARTHNTRTLIYIHSILVAKFFSLSSSDKITSITRIIFGLVLLDIVCMDITISLIDRKASQAHGFNNIAHDWIIPCLRHFAELRRVLTLIVLFWNCFHLKFIFWTLAIKIESLLFYNRENEKTEDEKKRFQKLIAQ